MKYLREMIAEAIEALRLPIHDDEPEHHRLRKSAAAQLETVHAVAWIIVGIENHRDRLVEVHEKFFFDEIEAYKKCDELNAQRNDQGSKQYLWRVHRLVEEK